MEYGVDIPNRRIYMIGDIDHDNFEAYLKAIHFFNDSDDKTVPIELYLATDGGDVEVMFAFYDAIRSSRIPIHTFATGGVCSAGVLVLVAGHTRFATENAWLMHHLSSSWADQEDERIVASRASQVRRWAERTYSLLAENTKKSAEWWEEQAVKKGELWLDSAGMLRHGVVDEVIKNIEREPRKRRKKK